MKTVVFTAQPFGFGPVSKMLAISEKITNARKIFFGSEVAYDLAKLHDFDEIYQFSDKQEREITSLLKKSDLFVNVMDFSLGSFVKHRNCPYFIIDVLLWFWPKKPMYTELADIYFCPDFFGKVEEKILQYQLKNAQLGVRKK